VTGVEFTLEHVAVLRRLAREPAPPSWRRGVEAEDQLLIDLLTLGLARWHGGGGFVDGQAARVSAPAHQITRAGTATLIAYELGRASAEASS